MGEPKAERAGVNESTYFGGGAVGFIDWFGRLKSPESDEVGFRLEVFIRCGHHLTRHKLSRRRA
jgi:hypothetical protein